MKLIYKKKKNFKYVKTYFNQQNILDVEEGP